MEKKNYTAPRIENVLLDNEILVLQISPKYDDLGQTGAGTIGGDEDQEPYNEFINPFKWFR